MQRGRSKLTILYFCVFVTIGIGLTASNSLADELDAIFIKANELYQAGNYQAAISEYNKIRNLGYESWEVYYNLGNAYYKSGDIARAILNYERARLLNPKHEDILFNLELANLRVVDRIEELPKLFFVAWIEDFANLTGLQSLGIVTAAFYLLLIGLLIYWILNRGIRRSRTALVVVLIVAGFLIVCSTILALRIYQNESVVHAIVLAPKVEVRSAPKLDSTEMFTLHEGVKVAIQENSGDWVRIRLADGKVGWLQTNVIEAI